MRTSLGHRGMRRRWAVAFATMFGLSAVTAATSFAVITQVVSSFRDAAVRVDRETAETVRLRAVSEEEWNAAHRVIDQTPGSSAEFLALDRVVGGQLDVVGRVARTPTQRAIVARLRLEWGRAFVLERDLAIRTVRPPPSHGAAIVRTHNVLNLEQRRLRRLFDALHTATRASLRHRLDTAAESRSRLTALLLAMVLLSLAATVLFARRMARDVLGPIGRLRDSWRRLGAGQSGERLVLDRDDELGELAATFNAMADALAADQLKLASLARHDALTGLANRRALVDRLGDDEAPVADAAGGVLFIDLDDFKLVNDSLGHQAGDALLREVAARLRACTRRDDLLVRLGGDEFAVVLGRGTDRAEDVAARILCELAVPFSIGSDHVPVGASIGIAPPTAEPIGPEEALRYADIAMYAAKAQGKNRWVVFDPAVHTVGSAAGS